MANVQIPKLNRFEPVNEPSVGRIDVKVPDSSQAIAPMQHQLSESADEAIKLYQHAEKSKADTEALRISNQYEQVYKEKLAGKNGIKWLDGDPTDHYNKFDTEMQDYYKSLLDEKKDASPILKQAVEAKLSDTHYRLYDVRSNTYGHQYNIYETKVTNDAVKLAQNDLLEASTHLKIEKPETIDAMQFPIDRIIKLRDDQGEKNGSVTRDTSGKVIRNPTVQYQLAKDLSDGLALTIQNLNADKKPELAQAMLEKYGEYIDAKHRPEITKQTQEQRIKNQAYDALSTALSKGSNSEKYLDSIADPEVKDKAYQLLDTRTREQEHIALRASTKNFDVLANQIINKMNSEDPYVNKTALEEDEQFKRLIPYVTNPRQKQALYNMVTKPKESDPTVKEKAYDSYSKGEFKGMPYSEFADKISGLNKEDSKKFETKWANLNSPEKAQTAAQEQAMSNNMTKFLDNALMRDGIISIDPKTNRMDTDDIALRANYRTTMWKNFENLPKSMPVAEQQAWIDKFVAANKVQKTNFFGFKIKDKNKDLIIPESTAPSAKTKQVEVPNAPVKPVVDNNKISDNDIAKQVLAYKRKYNKVPTPQELNEFIKQGNAK